MTDETPTLDDLMAKVGYFVFYWGLFETALVNAVKATGRTHETPSGVVERLKLWRRLVSRFSEAPDAATIADDVYAKAFKLRDVRNQIVHGLVRAHASPGTPYVECETLSGEKHKYTIDQLGQFARDIDSCRRAVLRLNKFRHDDREATQ